MQGAFYAIPIIYPMDKIPVSVAKFLLLNPIAQIIQDLRYALVTQESPTISSLYGNQYIRIVPLTITVLMAMIAASYFRSRSRFFAEDV